jgi:FkbM family methyltransferase
MAEAITYTAKVPMTLIVPDAMRFAIKDVLEGEYECGYDGAGLVILDIGANVGSFALWANARWPGSRITSFEPHPGTFAFLVENTKGRANVTPVNAALFPGGMKTATFLSRFAGDGESGLAAYAGDTFVAGTQTESYEVAVVDPATLPPADIVKIDIEGGEGDVLDAIDISKTSLVLLEYQNRKNKLQLLARLGADFDQLDAVEYSWDGLLGGQGYRDDLKGDVYGRIFAIRKGQKRLVKRG